MGVGATETVGRAPGTSVPRLVRLTSVTAGTPLLRNSPDAGRGRGGRIRTGGLLLPKQVRYQAALRPVTEWREAELPDPPRAEVMVIGAARIVAEGGGQPPSGRAGRRWWGPGPSRQPRSRCCAGSTSPRRPAPPRACWRGGWG